MSGVDLGERRDPQGRRRRDPRLGRVAGQQPFPAEVLVIVDNVARRGSTPLVVAGDH